MMRGITITIGGTMVTTVLLALAGTLQPLKDGDDGLPSEDLRVPLTATTSKLTVIMPEVQPQPPQPPPPPKSVGAEPTPTKSDNKIARRTPCISLLEPFEKMVIWQKINPKKWGLKRLWDECPAVQEGITRKVLVDIGANHLSTSINPFRKWYPDGQSFDVYAFEPLDFYVSGEYPSCVKCNYPRAGCWAPLMDSCRSGPSQGSRPMPTTHRFIAQWQSVLRTRSLPCPCTTSRRGSAATFILKLTSSSLKWTSRAASGL